MSEREVYPNAPVVLMVAEVRHSMCAPLERSQIAQLSAMFRRVLPVPAEHNEVSLEFELGPEAPLFRDRTVHHFARWSTRDRRTALSMRADSLSVETTQYGSYDNVRDILDLGLRAREAIGAPEDLERVGLRYIDEIRVPLEEVTGQPDWSQWIDEALLAPSRIAGRLGMLALRHEGALVLGQPGESLVTLRYGAQNQPAVVSSEELRRPTPPPGELFKLDIDSYWMAQDVRTPFDVEVVLSRADSLHEPVRGIFESVISERLREEVLRHG